MNPGDFSLSPWLNMVIVAGLATTLSYFGSVAALGVARHLNMIAQPGERQSHLVATPTGGGLGLIFSLLVCSFLIHLYLPMPMFWWAFMVPGILLLAIIGWLDDRRHVSSVLRLFVQLVVSLWLLYSLWIQDPFSHAGIYAGMIIAMIWLMNLYNFMDGSNGMAGFQGVFTGMVMAFLFYQGGQLEVAVLSFVVACVCCGFLPLNFPSARIFMGDVASVPLGFIFASFAAYGLHTGTISFALSVLIMSVFVIDASLTLLARTFTGEQWYTAHKQHVYQQLIARGASHGLVLMLYQAINVVLVLPAIMLAISFEQYANLIACITLFALGVGWCIANWKLGMGNTRQLV